ncbi:hypothetical protein PV11_05686 [Exophiala sideris]|uniref:C3H1-type domain-containing protein n=1 Tax=Exophiala sideris TaxID=1016849 RepID=A0A0D1YQP1_9EURO|nr:hypothetical protein PV11_05686 [Exophiala sideris]
MVVCKFFLQGNCKFGVNCRNEHPGTSYNNQQNRFGALSGGGGNRFSNNSNSRQDPWRINSADITNDLVDGKGRPKWILSAYGPGKDPPGSLLESNEYSSEEVRVRFYELASQGKQADADNEAIALWNKADQEMKQVASNVNDVTKFMEEAEKKHPNRFDMIQMDGTKPRDEFVKTLSAETGSGFGQASTPNPFTQASTPAFGQQNQPSGIGSAAFGKPSFGQSGFGSGGGLGQSPSGSGFGQAASSGTFGKPAIGGPSPAFGQPSQPTSTFGQPSQPAATFGQPSQPSTTFGQPSQPSAGFGQPSQPSSAFGQPAFGSSGFGANAAAKNPFAPASASGGLAQASATFGQPSQPSTTFGQPSQPTSTFGQASQPNSTFGQPSQPASAFGQASTPASTGFGQPASTFGQPSQPSSAFGQPGLSNASPFTASPSPGLGQPSQPTFGQTGFGSGSSSTPAFGQPSAAVNPFGVRTTDNPSKDEAMETNSPASSRPVSRANPFGTASAQPVAQPAPPTVQPAAANPIINTSSTPHPLTSQPPHAMHYTQSLPLQPTQKNASGQVSSYRGQRVQYFDGLPCYNRPDGKGWEKIWFPDAGATPDVVALNREDKLGDTQGTMDEYTEDIKNQYQHLFQEGRFKDGRIPLVPPMRDWGVYDF